MSAGSEVDYLSQSQWFAVVLRATGVWSSQDPVQTMEAFGRHGELRRIVEGRAFEGTEQKTVVIDATYLKAHRRASGPQAKKGVLTINAGV